MKTLTWNKFKEHVDLIMAKKGIDPNAEIDYIDITFPRYTVIGEELVKRGEISVESDLYGIAIYQ